MASLVTSMLCEGVFTEFPTLQVVCVEGGIAWAGPLGNWVAAFDVIQSVDSLDLARSSGALNIGLIVPSGASKATGLGSLPPKSRLTWGVGVHAAVEFRAARNLILALVGAGLLYLLSLVG